MTARMVAPATVCRELRNDEDDTPTFTYKELISAVAARKEARIAREREEKDARRARLAVDMVARKQRKAEKAAARAAKKAAEVGVWHACWCHVDATLLPHAVFHACSLQYAGRHMLCNCLHLP